jgi:plastocyanin
MVLSTVAAGALVAGVVHADYQESNAVSIVKTAALNGAERVGDTFAYQLTVTNKRAEPAFVRVLDVLPREVDLIGAPEITSTGAITASNEAMPPSSPEAETVSWSGSIAGNSEMRIAFRVKLIACPPTNDTGRYGIARAVNNTATLIVAGGVPHASAHSFVPQGCAISGTPLPRPTEIRPTPVPGADVAVRKYARLHPDVTDPDRGWVASWLVGYGNRGAQAAEDVKMVDVPSSNQTISGFRSAPVITPAIAEGAYTFDLGDLRSGDGGAFLVRSRLPFNTAPGTQLTNSVAISAQNDSNALNNRDAVTLTIPNLPPLITYPRSGVTCSGTLTITGRTQIGEIVEVIIDETRVATVTADSDGRWQLPVRLEDGAHMIHALNRGANGEVRRSPPVWIKVDSSLNWDPISLVFVGEDGQRQHARHWMGWLDRQGWYVTLAPSSTYTMSVRVCCDAASAVVTATIPGTGAIALADPDGDGVFAATFRTGTARAMLSGPFTLCVNCDDSQQCVRGRIVPRLDPEGRRRRHIVLMTRDGFEPRRVIAGPGDIVEFVNMDEGAHSISPRPNLAATASIAGVDADAGEGAFALEPGESYEVEIGSGASQTFYNVADSNQTTIVGQSLAVYLPMMRK